MTPWEELFPRRLHLLCDAPLYRPNPTFNNPAWEKTAFRALILRLSPFRDVQKSMTHLFLFRELKKAVPAAFIDMAFLPTAADRAVFRETGAPLILGTQSHRALSDFTMLFVSISCVPEIVNLPFMLNGSGIPLWAGARADGLPPILLGGSSVSAAHGLVREDGDCMADALFFGEGEGAAGRIAALWAAAPSPRPRRALLASIAAEVSGLWPAGDPSRRVARAVCHAEAANHEGIPFPMLPGEEAGTGQLQITRGCPCLCAFCHEGHERSPFRQIAYEDIERAARELKESRGAETLEISSFNFNTHERIIDILRMTNGLFARVSAMSQRADILAAAPGLLDAETAAGKRGFTIGVEGISGALRRFLHKSLEEADLKTVVEHLHALRVREIKLFYILTGREEEADFKELAAFIRWLSDLRMRGEGGPRMVFSFGLLVRMPFTPLRHDGLVLDGVLWRRLASRARSACGPFEFRLAAGIGEYLLLQALALGDRWTTDLVEELAGAAVVYDNGFPPDALEILHTWLDRHGGVKGELSAEKPEAHPFPLPFLDDPEERAFLHAQYVKAKMGIDDGYCRKGLPGGCGPAAARTRCASCTLGAHQGRPVASPARRAAAHGIKDPAAGLADSVAAKSRLKPFLLGVEIPRQWAPPDGTWLSAVLLHRLCAGGQGSNILAVREVRVTPWLEGFRGTWFGMGVAAVTAWDPLSAARAACRPDRTDGPRFLPFEGGNAGFSSITLAVEIPLDLFPRAEETVAAALAGMHAPFTAERDGDWYRMIVSPKARGKKILLGGRYKRNGSAFFLELEAGPKMSVQDLFKEFPGGGSGMTVEMG